MLINFGQVYIQITLFKALFSVFCLGNFKIFQNESFYTFSTTIDNFLSTEYCMVELEYSYTFKLMFSNA